MISRGQVYMVDLNPAKGREQRGRRPVLVVSADAINRQPLCFQIRSLDPGRFAASTYAGSLSPAKMAEVEQALKLTLNLT